VSDIWRFCLLRLYMLFTPLNHICPAAAAAAAAVVAAVCAVCPGRTFGDLSGSAPNILRRNIAECWSSCRQV